VLPFATVTLIGSWLWIGRFAFTITEGSIKVVELPLSMRATNFILPIVTNSGKVFAAEAMLDIACIEISNS
jgi:hypothetical protein